MTGIDNVPDFPLLDSPQPYFTANFPGIGGLLKREPDDFVVEEIPAYLPSGEGEHLFLWIEKRDVSAEDLFRHVARELRIPLQDVGRAGLKDRHAVTRQWLSVPAGCAEHMEAIDTTQIRVLDSALHTNKLRRSHLKGNRFSILVREPANDAASRAAAVAEQIEQHGFPNYFGDQRFGTGGETATLGFALLCGEKRPRDIPHARRRFLLPLAVSAAQSVLFNSALAARITDGLLQRVLPGDVMQVVASGGPFVVEDVAAEQQRYDSGEIVPAGPMFGPKMKQPTADVAEREAAILESFGLGTAAFTPLRKFARGTRRPYVIRPAGLTLTPEDAGLRFAFTLPPGVYATTLLREFLKTDRELPSPAI